MASFGGNEKKSHLSNSPALAFEEIQIRPVLENRRRVGSLRKLVPYHGSNTVDFSSNDYLGLAQSAEQHDTVQDVYRRLQTKKLLGSTGSRLLTGDSEYAHTLEQRLAKWHKRPAALLCNSGYDANLSVFSALTLDATVLFDELCHNSIVMGLRLSKGCTQMEFSHNNLKDLKEKLLLLSKELSLSSKPVIVVVESVYSMDGDKAPLQEICDLALSHGACIIVDEAHGLGVFGDDGMGVLSEYGLEHHPSLLCSVHTFGKAAGCHGAVVCGSSSVVEYLYNYGRPIVYSTSLPLHSLVTIACSYQSMTGLVGKRLRTVVKQRVDEFRHGMKKIMISTSTGKKISLVPSISPIQALIIPGNHECLQFCDLLWNRSAHRIRLYPIRSPTVPKGQERVRIIIHAHNTSSEIDELLSLIEATLMYLNFIPSKGPTTILSKM